MTPGVPTTTADNDAVGIDLEEAALTLTPELRADVELRQGGLMVLGGVQLLMIGVMGEYIAKILSETKARPVYLVAEHSLRQATPAAATVPETAVSTAE